MGAPRARMMLAAIPLPFPPAAGFPSRTRVAAAPPDGSRRPLPAHSRMEVSERTACKWQERSDGRPADTAPVSLALRRTVGGPAGPAQYPVDHLRGPEP